MTNEPGLAGTSLVEFGQGGEYHSESMSVAKQTSGFAPLETLPAEWYNNYMALLDKHINQLQVLTQEIQTELSNIITWDNQVTPSSGTLTQVLSGITRKIQDMLPVIATGSTPGLVVSSAADSAVSVGSDGVMTYNGHGALLQEIADAEDTLSQTIADKVEELEDTIEGRAHVIALNVANNSSTDTALMLTATSRVDGGSLDAYTPAAGDMIVLVCPTAVQELTDRVSLTLTIGSNQLTYTNSDGITLGQSNVFTLITFASASGTMVMTSGTGGGGGLQYFKTITTVVDPDDESERQGLLLIGFTGGYVPQYGDIIRIQNTEYTMWGEYMYTRDGWVVIDAAQRISVFGRTVVSTSVQQQYSEYGAAIQMYLGKGCPYLGATGSDYYYMYTDSICIDVFSSKPLSNLTGFNIIGYDLPQAIETSAISADFRRIYVTHLYKVGTAFRLNNVSSSNTNLCYADAQGNLHAHTLELT